MITADNNHALIGYYKKLLSDNKTKNRFALEYGYSLALQDNQQFAEAQSIMDKLMNDYPDQLIFQWFRFCQPTSSGQSQTCDPCHRSWFYS